MDASAPFPIDYDALFAEANAAVIDEASLKAEADRLLVVSSLLARKGRLGEAFAMAKLARMQFAALAARRRLEPKPPKPVRPTGMRWFDDRPLSHGRSNPFLAELSDEVDEDERELGRNLMRGPPPAFRPEKVAEATKPAPEAACASPATEAPRTDLRRMAMMRRLRQSSTMTAVVHTHMGQAAPILRQPPTPPP